MHTVLANIFRRLGGWLQWHILWLFHPKFIVGIQALVTTPDRKSVLLLRHRYWQKGSWGLPSGYMNRDETIEQALVREIREELNANVSEVVIVNVQTGYRLRVLIVLRATISAGEPFTPDKKEVMDARLFYVNALPDGLLPAHRDLIRKYLNC